MAEDVTAARSMLTSLSDLLRASLQNVGSHEIPLKEELEFLKHYLEIEQTRFHDRLTVRLQIEPQTLDASVPNLILQPLVENAIRHGIAPHAGPGVIEIRAARRDGMIELQVLDNGPGLARLHQKPCCKASAFRTLRRGSNSFTVMRNAFACTMNPVLALR